MSNVPLTAFYWVEGVISSTVTWLNSWSFHGVPILMYMIGYALLSILLSRLFR